MAEYLNIKNKIKDKLETIEGIKIVHNYEKQDLGGFPAVVILGFTINDILEDTITNLREYTFKVRVFQELASTDPKKAEEIIDNLIDTLMDLFGKDFTLGGTCEGCWVKSGLGWVDREIGMRVYDMEILAKKLISFIPGEYPPVPISEYPVSIRKLATIENVDLKVTGATVIYTVPIGMKLIPVGFDVRVKTRTNPNGDASYELNRVSDDGNFVTDGSNTLLDPIEHLLMLQDHNTGQSNYIVFAGDSIEIDVKDAETGDALIIDVDLIGYLIKE